MIPRIETLSEKKIVGKRLRMSLTHNKMAELWGGFMPKRQEIAHKLSSDLFSMTIYNSNHFEDYNPSNEFEKWAGVEVSKFENIPNDLEEFILMDGLYAVFDYKGPSTDTAIYQYIFGKWLPNSEFVLANRPHFEVLANKYKNDSPNSEEEIWIPIQKK